MSEWEEAYAEDGSVYYYNVRTQETSWEKPIGQNSASEWSVFKTDDGREYYYNEKTQETTWSPPPGINFSTAVVESEKEKSESSPASTSIIKESKSKSQLDERLESERVLESSIVNPPQFESVEDAEDAFKKILQDSEVDSTWSFQKVMSTFITNPTYWAINDPLRRQQLYDEYLLSRIQQEAENRNKVVEKLEENFIQELKKYQQAGKLNDKTRWVTIKDLLIRDDNPIFKLSVLSDNQVVKIFIDFRNKLRSERNKSIQENRKQALFELETYLMDMKPAYITNSRDWNELYGSLTEDPRFQANKHFSILSKADILELYQTCLYPQEIKKLKDQIHQIDKANKRRDRKARHQFSDLLNTLDIKSTTTFQDVYSKIEDHDCFIELCGRRGSTPMELFWDILDEKEQSIKLKKDLINTAITDYCKKSPTVDITLHKIFASYEIFHNTILQIKDERLSSFNLEINDESLHEVFTGLRIEYLAQQEKRLQSFNKKLAHVIQECARQLSFTYTNIACIAIVNEEGTESESQKVFIQRTEPSDGTTVYTLQVASIGDEVTEELKQLKELRSLVSLINDFYSDNETSEPIIKDSINKVLVELAAVLTSQESKKRPREEEEISNELKKTKRELVTGKPVLMNY